MSYKFFLGVFIFIVITMTPACKKPCNQVEKWEINCIYTKEYNPVCGCNGKTYQNSSHAKCRGITEYTSGPCF